MPFVPTPPTRKTTGLWSFGFRLEAIARYFANLATDIQDVWIIGKWLSFPFALISVAFAVGQSYVWQADQELGQVLSWIDDFLDGWLIIDLLEGLWSELRELRRDPVTWVLRQIIRLWVEFERIRNDPVGWFREKLTRLIPTIWYLFENTRQWFYDQLSRYWPLMSEWFNNPYGMLINMVYSTWPIIREFVSNASYFVYDRLRSLYPILTSLLNSPSTTVINLLTSRYPDLVTFLSNPYVWIRDKLFNIIGVDVSSKDGFITSILLNVLYYLQVNRQGLRDRIINALCDIFVAFI